MCTSSLHSWGLDLPICKMRTMLGPNHKGCLLPCPKPLVQEAGMNRFQHCRNGDTRAEGTGRVARREGLPQAKIKTGSRRQPELSQRWSQKCGFSS